MSLPARVTLVEVGPRDGLQNEPTPASVEARVAFIEALAEAGLSVIEAGSFVSPKWVPQMAGTDEVLARLRRRPGVSYPVLVPNLKGLEAALAAEADAVAIFAAASESFSMRNINATVDESFERFAPVAREALASGLRVRGYVSTVIACPYEGSVAQTRVTDVARRLLDLGCYEVSLGDTIGVGTPATVRALLDEIVPALGAGRLAVHFHDTYGQAVANIAVSLDYGIAVVDASTAGLGGCPYAPGASGNAATEDVLFLLRGLGIETGVDIDAVARAGWAMGDALGRAPASKVSLALRAACATTA